MIFYVIQGLDGGVGGCETSLAKARAKGRENFGGDEFTIDRVTIELPPREAMRLMLAGWGGYASDVVRVYPKAAANTPDPAPVTRIRLGS